MIMIMIIIIIIISTVPAEYIGMSLFLKYRFPTGLAIRRSND